MNREKKSNFHVRYFWDDFQMLMNNSDAVTLFLYLKFRAERKGGNTLVKIGKGYQKVYLKRGQLISGERQLARKLGWKRHRIRNALNHLSDHLKTETYNQQYSVISLLRFDRYNGPMSKAQPLKKPKTQPTSRPYLRKNKEEDLKTKRDICDEWDEYLEISQHGQDNESDTS